MNRFSVSLENGFGLEKSEIIFKSDSTKISRLEANLKTSSSRIKFKIEAGSELAELINSWRSVPFSLEIDDTEISADDILSFLPGLKEHPLLKAQKDLRLGIKYCCRWYSRSVKNREFQPEDLLRYNIPVVGAGGKSDKTTIIRMFC